MSARLPRGGRALDRTRPLRFTFDGRAMTGFAGDTVASALMANGVRVVGRSFKYHRPRGVVASGTDEPNALVTVGEGLRRTPNLKATCVRLEDGMTVASQNRWPSLRFDAGAVNAALAPLFPAGFYYKTFMWPRAAWKHVYEPVIRAAAGLGRPPEGPDPDRYEHFHAHADVLVIGGGLSGLAAALAAGRAGAEVLVIEQDARWGGRGPTDGVRVDGRPAGEWAREAVAELAAMPHVRMRPNTMAAGHYDHGYVLARETVGEGVAERLWRIRAARVVVAAGALERPVAFAGNDLPGVMLASAMRDHLDLHGVIPGSRVVVTGANDDAYRTALVLHGAGVHVAAVVDARAAARGRLPDAARAAGLDVREGRAVAEAGGSGRVRWVRVTRHDGDGTTGERIACDAVAMSGGWSPAVHLWSHAGGKLVWDEASVMFAPDPARPPVGHDGAPSTVCAGTAAGDLHAAAAMAGAWAVGCAVAGVAPSEGPRAEASDEVAPMALWQMPAAPHPKLEAKAFLDPQNDVKVADVRLAAREGFESVEHAKRYTTLGMATDQGKLSNVVGLAILSDALGQAIPQTGTTTFRPPYDPITFGTVAGEAKGDLFQPVRESPLHDRHEAAGAHWEPVGHWRRPYCYLRPGETPAGAVEREVLNTRQNLGLLDASTLGKIVVQGPDAGRFLDMLYTGVMSTLAPGRCKYGLMCSENGFLMDDGVVARLGEETWLCHTTTGGAGRVHGHMEEWLQTEWPDWRVHVLDATEVWGQVAVVGPNARAALEALGGMDVSREALPFMRWTEGTLAGLPARVFRISFSGELSYEVAVPAHRTRALWDRLHEVGAPLGAMPYGTEALHVMRAEKGFVMIGDETDGTVIPQDLGMGWAISKRKPDYIGLRAQRRADMAREDRWRLVGLETLDGGVLPDGAYAVGEGTNAWGNVPTIGRVTSTYRSPTLGRGIAMGLVERGPERMGEVLDFPGTDGRTHRARIVSPVFYDPEGERLHG